MAKKTGYRSDFKKILANLDERWITAASQSLAKQLLTLLNSKLDFDVTNILCFSAFFAGEVDLTPFIAEQINVRKMYLPLVHPDARMTFISISHDWKKLARSGSFGILEPDESGESFNPELSPQTAVLVPGLAFDQSGNRLGRGRGYYDRFLSRPQFRSLLKIGVCWEMQLIDEVPVESHDIMMDWVCHERGVVRTGLAFDEE